MDDQEFMPLASAVEKWGHKIFSAEEFKGGNVKTRAAMAASLIESKSFVGKSRKDIQSMLGYYTGYFWSERIPAYTIEEGWETKGDTWQLVFLLDSADHVSEIRIHKNCCYKNSSERLKKLDLLEKTVKSLKK